MSRERSPGNTGVTNVTSVPTPTADRIAAEYLDRVVREPVHDIWGDDIVSPAMRAAARAEVARLRRHEAAALRILSVHATRAGEMAASDAQLAQSMYADAIDALTTAVLK
jgi:hypothetical protein